MTEQITKLPKDWKWVKLNEICDKVSLNKIKIKQKQYLPEGKYPVIDQGQDLIGGYFNDEKLIVPNEPPYIIFGDHTKIKKFINFKFIPGADGVKVLKPKEIIEPKFLFYSLFTIKIEDKGYARHFQLLEKELFPVPPLPTQQAIISKIEELFSELDKGIEDLKTSQQQLKTYRQSVLKYAFEGKLTNKKVKDGVLPKEWKWVKLREVAKDISDGDHQAPPKAITGIPFITISNVNKSNNQIDFAFTFKVNTDYYLGLKQNRKPQKGDVLYTVTGSYGIPILIDYEKDFCFQRHIGLVRPLDTISQKWLFYLLQSPQVFSQAKETATGTAQKTVALGSLRNFDIAYCHYEEQTIIVQEIENRLSVADKMEESIGQSLLQAEALRQSILKKAFSGELI
jgi:type I restriction enzyme S subunit